MGKWYVERYKATRVYIECPACNTGIIRFARDSIPDKCPVCGSENEGGGYLNIKVYHDKGECNFIEPFYIDGEHAESLAEAYEIWNTRSGV